ncbi:MAG: SMR family transporter, partial [Planctomycetales bacterium]
LAATKAVAGPAVICMVGYGMFLFFFGKALSSIQIGVAYSTLAGVGTVLVTILAVIFHGQKIDMPAVAGILLIILGVLVIYMFSEVRVRD